MTEVSLILVRHATAEDYSGSGRDAERKLTDLGRFQAKQLADAARCLGLPQAAAIMTSGYVRAMETRAAFDWLEAPEFKDSSFSPYGRVSEAADVLRGHRASGSNVIWVFAHNPLLTVFLRDYAPTLLDLIGKVRKADLVWLRWRSGGDFLHRHPELKGFLSKPRGAPALPGAKV